MAGGGVGRCTSGRPVRDASSGSEHRTVSRLPEDGVQTRSNHHATPHSAVTACTDHLPVAAGQRVGVFEQFSL